MKHKIYMCLISYFLILHSGVIFAQEKLDEEKQIEQSTKKVLDLYSKKLGGNFSINATYLLINPFMNSGFVKNLSLTSNPQPKLLYVSEGKMLNTNYQKNKLEVNNLILNGTNLKIELSNPIINNKLPNIGAKQINIKNSSISLSEVNFTNNKCPAITISSATASGNFTISPDWFNPANSGSQLNGLFNLSGGILRVPAYNRKISIKNIKSKISSDYIELIDFLGNEDSGSWSAKGKFYIKNHKIQKVEIEGKANNISLLFEQETINASFNWKLSGNFPGLHLTGNGILNSIEKRIKTDNKTSCFPIPLKININLQNTFDFKGKKIKVNLSIIDKNNIPKAIYKLPAGISDPRLLKN